MCNISGALKQHNKKWHNIDALRFLAMFGSDRGKDSFGISHNNEISYWVREGYNGNEGNAALIFQSQSFPENIKTPIVLMHNRAATVGIVNENGAHPYIIDNLMVGMKNGTLYNHEALGKKYNIEPAEWNTDSELLLTIIHRYGTDVLKEYIGGCAMAWFFLDEPDKLYLWKGASLNYNKIEEERPLWYVFDERNRTMYFNSLKAPLQAITNCKYFVESVPDNTLMIFKDGELLSEEFIDRSAMSQKPVYDASTWDNGLFKNGKNKHYHTSNLPAKPKAVEQNPQNGAGTRVYHYNGNYYHNGHFLEGEHIIDISTQEVVPTWDVYNMNLRRFYFIKGVWLKNEETYDEILSRPGRSTMISDVHQDAFCRNSQDNKWYKNGVIANFTGCPVYFGYGMYTLKDGVLISYHPLSNKFNKDPLLMIANKFFYDTNLSQYAISREEIEQLVLTWSSTVVNWTSAAALRLSLEQCVMGEQQVKSNTEILQLGAWGMED